LHRSSRGKAELKFEAPDPSAKVALSNYSIAAITARRQTTSRDCPFPQDKSLLLYSFG